ncbi:fungal specific transcription factor [Cordyceps javanica]|uniref:Fungal specific transcription factor n=1 Tax=Cordyceps javanica TaxID=43265 RepID=A0A545WEV0_9HYPO|nr:fungal specific transcription factor [Cordyceps javanica]TQW12472.1 fungal specific transcription factor [Cordyceps javanica]
MKLCCDRTSIPKTSLYHAVKRLQFDIESAGILSLQHLQASILIAIYELGHAVYPAAVLSVGRCARYAACLGIDNTARPPASIKLPWVEVEECCRVWWSIVILDRFLNICDPQRHPAAADPGENTFLPVDDAAWDSGTSQAADAVTLGRSSASHLARYGRFAQAAHLLAQVNTRAPETYEEATQLRRTIMALVNLAEAEGSWKRWGFLAF